MVTIYSPKCSPDSASRSASPNPHPGSRSCLSVHFYSGPLFSPCPLNSGVSHSSALKALPPSLNRIPRAITLATCLRRLTHDPRLPPPADGPLVLHTQHVFLAPNTYSLTKPHIPASSTACQARNLGVFQSSFCSPTSNIQYQPTNSTS